MALALGLLVLMVIAVDRLFGGPPTEPLPPEPEIAIPAQGTPAPSNATGQVSIITRPGAKVSVNEEALGTANASGVAGPFSLGEGRQIVRVAHPKTGFERIRAISVRAGQIHEVEIQARHGVLRLQVQPWAKVRIDGREVGITPLQDLNLVEGSHQVELVNPDIQRRQDMLVRIEAGRVRQVKINLAENR